MQYPGTLDRRQAMEHQTGISDSLSTRCLWAHICVCGLETTLIIIYFRTQDRPKAMEYQIEGSDFLPTLCPFTQVSPRPSNIISACWPLIQGLGPIASDDILHQGLRFLFHALSPHSVLYLWPWILIYGNNVIPRTQDRLQVMACRMRVSDSFLTLWISS